MNHFDVQRVESLMRYAEFLESMGYEEYRKEVVHLLQKEIVGKSNVEGIVETVSFHNGEGKYHELYTIHPAIEQYVQQQIKKATPEVYEEHIAFEPDKIQGEKVETLHPKLRYYVQQEIKQQINN
ncbi:hypothetical protein [Virgibacillus pantothenticus]|uniref:Uncharacterized protein n=1 Tax=Virgibacillus pantothenticus TaxID=1473 RepID=A0A0L0QKM6_VIRPA|nr:hypothetical protein [Virgibacillus pantothenticus]KNE19054.1 hypothetical protein AFK71_10860 [Virgibacillus pantothenticus]MED3738963.1 hypothetical protein [Virgibacillus pantothenticus]QTY15496.1 hypothetical protein KBP50_16625 [Virgibacillus pantothenticus]SIT16682.1 hypothetical protein SAMN05421787_12723 [Virgibacillus pantothenticus]